jgi:chromosome partitioning protein
LGWPLDSSAGTLTGTPSGALGWPEAAADASSGQDDVTVDDQTAMDVAPHTEAARVRTSPSGISVDVSRGTTTGVSRETTTDVSRGTSEVAPMEADYLPRADSDTPLAQQVSDEARRRIALRDRPMPRPGHTRVFAVANQKGGVGKTTTTVNLAAALGQGGLNVLVIDLDPQGNASTALGIDHHADVPSIYDVVVEGRPLIEVVQTTVEFPTLHCAPATLDLAGAEIELVSLVARENRLLRALQAYLAQRDAAGMERLDYVFIDCPPSLGLLTINAFVAAGEVLIPIQCEYYALEGLSQLLKNIQMIQAHLNPGLHVSSILMTMYDGRTRLSSQVADEVRTHFPAESLRTTVPRSVRISEAPSHGQTVITYDPSSSGALSYLEAATELAERGAAAPGDDGNSQQSTDSREQR